MITEGKTAKGRYASLEQPRESFLERARESARLTIPSLMPEDAHSHNDDFYTPYQSMGSRGLNNLASKLLIALLPPNAPFFRLSLDQFTIEKLTQDETAKSDVEEALARYERTIHKKVEEDAVRVPTYEALRQLIVAGNVLIYYPKEGNMRVFRMDRYVVKRDPMGNLLEIITKEEISREVADMYLHDGTAPGKPALEKTDENPKDDKNVELYTWIKLVEGKFMVAQEIEGEIVPGSIGSYPKDKLPWLALRMNRVDGEDWGRGYVEEFYGDLKSLEGLTKAIVEGAAAAAKTLILIKPGGNTDMETVAESENLDILSGDGGDVSVIQMQKFADFRVALETTNQIKDRLSHSFLMNSAIQRNAERVTAEEIRFMAQELDAGIGGLFALLSQEFQMPLVRILSNRLTKSGKVAKLPKEVSFTIITGLDALGRGDDLQKLQSWLASVTQIAQVRPEILQSINERDLLKRLSTAIGIEPKGLVKSEEQVQAEQQAAQAAAQQQQQMEMAQQLGPEAIRQLSGN